MPSKYYLRNFYENGFYHIFNRGSRKLEIFYTKQDYQVFIEILSYYLKFPQGNPLSKLNYPQDKTQPTYQLLSYCLMPNHFHLLIYQHKHPTEKNSIATFIHKLSTTYAMHFNKINNCSGSLFEGSYKNVTITSEEQLHHLSRYIHQNPLSLSKYSHKNLHQYSYSSYPTYINQQKTPWINTKTILKSDYYKNSKNPHKTYQKFVQQPSNPAVIKEIVID